MMNDAGTIKLYTGPVCSGKTSSMLEAVKQRRIANKACIVVKSSKDTRYDKIASENGIASHAGVVHKATPVVVADHLMDVFDEISEYEVVGIDEIQFFEDNIEVVQELASFGIEVICSGLDGNFRGKSFGRMGELFPIAEEIIKLKAVCMECSRPASFTKKIAGGDEEVEIGGLEKYVPVCRKCMWGGIGG
jgi:thymidine kinase